MIFVALLTTLEYKLKLFITSIHTSHITHTHTRAECMSTSRSVCHLDLRHNHIKSNGAMFLADGLRFNDGSCETIDLSFNPLMKAGVSYILRAKEQCQVKHWGLQSVLQSSAGSSSNGGGIGSSNSNGTSERRKKIHHRDMSGYYVLHLDDPVRKTRSIELC